MSWHNHFVRMLRSVCHDQRIGQFRRSAAVLASPIGRPLVAAFVPSRRSTLSGREQWVAHRRSRVERLEPRLVLTPLVVDLGSDARIRGLGRPDDDTVVLIGNSNPRTQQEGNEPRLVTLSTADSSFSVVPLPEPRADSFVWGVSQNGQYIAGWSKTVNSEGLGEGVVWNRNDLSNPHQVGHIGSFNQSPAFGVSNNGFAAGDANGGLVAYQWDERIGIVGLPSPDIAAATNISAASSTIIGVTRNNVGAPQASVWDEAAHAFLDDPFLLGSRADVVSPNGRIIGGFTAEFDFDSFETLIRPVVWTDRELTIIPDANGDSSVGYVNGVTDNGYVVGTTANDNGFETDEGFIWNPDFPNGARLFDEWLATEYGVTLPHPSASVMDVVLYNNALNFAVDACPPTSSPDYESCTDGSQYFVSVPLGTPPRIVDLSAEADNVVGVAALPNGTTLLVGNVIDPATSDSEAFLYTVSPDGSTTTTQLGSLGGSTTVTGISQNGQYISGYSVSPLSVGLGEGAVWMTNDPANPLGVGHLGSANQSPAFHVSNGGVAVGHADGARQAFRWTQGSGIQAIPATPSAEVAQAISELNNVVVGEALNTSGTAQAAVWYDGAFAFLDDPFRIESFAYDVSPSGQLIGGYVGEFNFDAARTIEHAAIWENGVLNLLKDRNGDPFEGEVLAVTNNGYAVGATTDDRAFIWHESFPNAGVMLFDDWLLAEYGVSLPTPTMSVTDVMFDGKALNFAVNGSAYFVRTVIDAAPGFTVTESDAATVVDESGATDTFTVVLNAAPASDVVITVASENTAEVIVDPASLTFTPENWDQPQTITVTGQDDDDPDGNTNTVIRLVVDADNSDDAFDMLLDRRVIVTTTDNEVTSAHPWQNISNPLDVDNDSDVSPIDALLVFNVLNKSGSHQLPAGGPSSTNGPFVDVNGDDFVSPVDALVVINFLNKVFVQGEAEASLILPRPRHGTPSRAEVASAAEPLPKADNNMYVRGPVGSLRDRPAPSDARRHLFATLSEADAFWNESAVESLTDCLATEIALTNSTEA